MAPVGVDRGGAEEAQWVARCEANRVLSGVAEEPFIHQGLEGQGFFRFWEGA